MTIYTGGLEDNIVSITSADGTSTIDLDGGIDTLTINLSDSTIFLSANFKNGTGTVSRGYQPIISFSGIDRLNFLGGIGSDSYSATVGPTDIIFFDGGDQTNLGNGYDGFGIDLTAISGPITFALDETPGAISTFVGQGSSIRNIEAVAIRSGSGDDTLTGGSQIDQIEGGGGRNVIHAGGGNDSITSRAGIDTVYGDAGHDFWTIFNIGPTGGLYQSDGNGTFSIYTGSVSHGVEGIDVRAGDGDDHFNIRSDITTIFIEANGGHDSLSLDWSDVTVDLFGTAREIVTLPGDPADHYAYWDTEESSVRLGSGNDSISVIDGSNFGFLDGGDGDDLLTLSVGYLYSPGNIFEFSLNDAADAADAADADNILPGFGTFRNFERIHFFATSGDDSLTGGHGDDWLEGRSGNDRLYGGDGNDILQGGEGNDFLRGGAGADQYVFDTSEGARLGKDIISGFSGEDLILVANPLFDSNRDGIIDFGDNRKLDLPGSGLVSVYDDSGHLVTALQLVGKARYIGGVREWGDETGSGYLGNVDYYTYSLVGAQTALE